LNHRASFVLLIGLGLIVPIGTRASTPQKLGPRDPAQAAVRAFYQFHLIHEKNFTARNVRLRKRWLTPELFGLLLGELKREAEESKAHPDEAPYFEGDPFTDSQEYPDSFRVGQSEVNGDLAKVTVTLLWSARTSRGRDKRDIVVEVTRTSAAWLINDVLHGDGGRLKDELKRPR